MPDGQDTFNTEPNPYAWNKIAHIVYIESPAGVGYSYVDAAEIPEYTDESSAADNYEAVKAFFAAEKFADLKDNDVYIAGESYAGIYVPFLAHKILVEKKDTTIKLKGILVGNGVTDLKYDSNALWAMGFWHNVIDKNLENKLVKNHCFPKELSVYQEPTKTPSPACPALFDEFETKLAGINIYDVYRKCWYDETKTYTGLNSKGEEYFIGMTAQDYTPWVFPEHARQGKRLEQNGVPCVYAQGTTKFFNEDLVKSKLHANEDKISTWELCTNGKRIKYTSGVGSIQLYQDLVDAGLRILHFTGNTDGAVPAIGTRTWVT